MAVGFVALFLLLLNYPRTDGHLFSGDGAFYYGTLRSVILDHDLRIENELQLINERIPKNSSSKGYGTEGAYAFSIGPAILWSPFFLIGHEVALACHGLGMPVAVDGFSWIEESFVCIAGILYGCVGLFLTFRLVNRWIDKQTALYAVIFVFGATSASYYVAIENWMSHALQLFSLSIFFLFSQKERSEFGVKYFATTGFLLALVFLVRWQDVLFGVVLLDPLSKLLRLDPARRIRNVTIAILSIGASFFAGASLQLVYWKSIFGSYITIPQGNDFIQFSHVHILEVLFSTKHGLVTWTPIVLLGISGLFPARDRRENTILLIIALALQIFFCSAVADWWAGDAFGSRRLINLFPILCIGFARLLERTKHTSFHRFLMATSVCLVIWNGLFILQYTLRLIPRSDFLTFQQLVTDKVTLPFQWLKP